jgi:hypothetical protein
LDLLLQAVQKLRTETNDRLPGTVVGDELAQLHWLIEALQAEFLAKVRDRDRCGPYAPSHIVRSGRGGWIAGEFGTDTLRWLI